MATKAKDCGRDFKFDPKMTRLLSGSGHQIGFRPVPKKRLVLGRSDLAPVNLEVQRVVSMLLSNLKNARDTPPD